MESTPHPTGISIVSRPTQTCSPLVLESRATKHVTLYPRQLFKYASNSIFVSVSSITSKPPHSTARMACTIPKPRPSRMFRVLMASPGRRQGRRDGGGDAVCRQSAEWGIGQEKLRGILVRNKRKKKRRIKKPRIGFRTIYGRHFFVAHLSSSGRCLSKGVGVSDATKRLVRGRRPLACLQPRFHL